MDAKTHALFEARAQIIKAMAHPTRLFIVDELSRRERCVQELTEMIGSDVSTVSRSRQAAHAFLAAALPRRVRM